MSNKHDLKIARKAFTGTGVENVIGAVPDGKTRFICMIKVGLDGDTIKLNGVSIIDGELVTSDTTVVDRTDVPVSNPAVITNLIYPDAVDTDNPLFSIAAGRFLNIKGAVATMSGTVEFVYFDE